MTAQHVRPQTYSQQMSLENVIIGACLLEKDIFEQVNRVLDLEDFSQPITRKTWSAMHELHKKSYPIDIVTVVEYLCFHQPNFKASQFLDQLVMRVSNTNNVIHWSFLLVELTFRSKAIRKLKAIKHLYPSIVGEMLEELKQFQNDVFDVLSAIKSYSDQVGGKLSKTVDDFYKEMQGRIEEIKYQNPKLVIK